MTKCIKCGSLNSQWHRGVELCQDCICKWASSEFFYKFKFHPIMNTDEYLDKICQIWAEGKLE